MSVGELDVVEGTYHKTVRYKDHDRQYAISPSMQRLRSILQECDAFGTRFVVEESDKDIYRVAYHLSGGQKEHCPREDGDRPRNIFMPSPTQNVGAGRPAQEDEVHPWRGTSPVSIRRTIV